MKLKQIGVAFISLVLSLTFLCGFVSVDTISSVNAKGFIKLKAQYPENIYVVTYDNNISMEFVLLPNLLERATTSRTGYGRFYFTDTDEDVATFSLKASFTYDGSSVYVSSTPVKKCESFMDGYKISGETPETGTTEANAYASCVFELKYNGEYSNGATITVYCTNSGKTSAVVS